MNLNNFKLLLFTNQKDGNEKRPDFNGFVTNKNTDEKPFKASAWKNVSKNGQEYLSVTFQESTDLRFEKKEAEPMSASVKDDDIPF